MSDDIPGVMRQVQADLESKAKMLEQEEAGKITAELNYKDGRWSAGNVSITFPRRHRK